jgi:hypothetical protein
MLRFESAYFFTLCYNPPGASLTKHTQKIGLTGLVDLLELAKYRERTSDGDPVLQRFPKNLAIGAVSQTKMKIISFSCIFVGTLFQKSLLHNFNHKEHFDCRLYCFHFG